MPSKKKKYNSRFPPARIKKIMQTDDDIGKVAAAVPVLISKCLEMFLASILTHTGEVTKAKKAKTMSTSHLKECIMNVNMFDFLKDVVANVPEMQNDDEPSTSNVSLASFNEETRDSLKKRSAPLTKHPKKRIKLSKSHQSDGIKVMYVKKGEDQENVESGEASDDEQANNFYSMTSSQASMTSSQASLQINPNPAAVPGPSFHIPLDCLTSSDHDAAPLLQIVTSENESSSIQELNVTTNSKPENKDVLHNGLSSQNAMDLTMNSLMKPANPSSGMVQDKHGNKPESTYEPAPVKKHTDKLAIQSTKENTGVSLQPRSGTGLPPVMPTAINVPNLYSSISMTSPVPGVTSSVPGVSNPTRGLNTKHPPGGMLSFLYSEHPTETPNLPPHISVDVKPQHHVANFHDISASSDRTTLYPYNPIAEHYKRTTPSHPYMPSITQDSVPGSNHIVTSKRLCSDHLKEDDDYDA